MKALHFDGRLRIEARDDGGKVASTRDGLGLANTRARLTRLYGQAAQPTLTIDESGDTVAAFDIPFATTP